MTQGVEKLGDILERLSRREGWGKRLSEGKALLMWKDVVGESVRAHTRPVRIDNGKMTIAVDDSLWKQEVGLLQGEIIRKLNDRMGKKVVRDIRLVVCR